MKKQCSKCKEFKDLSMFGKRKNGFRGQCRPCINKRKSDWYKNNPEQWEKKLAWGRNNRKDRTSYRKTYNKRHRKEIRLKKLLVVENLSDSYVKTVICQRTGLSHKDIPQEMVEARRQYMKLNRIIREGK